MNFGIGLIPHNLKESGVTAKLAEERGLVLQVRYPTRNLDRKPPIS